jgi:hypothetical protein
MKHYTSFTLPPHVHRPLIIGSGACHSRHGPVILSDARPEHPDHDDCEQGEERLKQPTVDLAIGALADVHTDYVLENLSDSEQDGGTQEVY